MTRQITAETYETALRRSHIERSHAFGQVFGGLANGLRKSARSLVAMLG